MSALAAVLATILACLTAGPLLAQGALTNGDFETGPPPGPGIADAWMPFSISGPPPDYQMMSSDMTPWAVLSGERSQMWFAPVSTYGGIFQHVADLVPGQQYSAGVYFSDPDPMGPFGPTLFRIGIEPNGAPPMTGTVTWGSWMPVTAVWQLAEVAATVYAPTATVVLQSSSAGAGGPPNYQNPSPFNRTIVDGAHFVPKSKVLQGVPDMNQPPNDPLGTGDVSNHCAPVSAVNITQYYANQCPGIDANLPAATAAGYIGYWMDTNDDGCPFRCNGTVFRSAGGTYTADLAAGLAQYARWDGNNSLGCTPPPNLPVGKNGYSWTVNTAFRTGNNLNGLWNQLVNEIVFGRPMIITWSYWRPIDSGVTQSGVRFYTWGEPQNQPDPGNPNEEWTDATTPTAGGSLVGHMTTAVGYWKNYDPDGAGGPLPQTNWVIVHDNWPTTAVDVAIPWQKTQQFSPWAASTTVNTAAPQKVGAISERAGPKQPKDHWGWYQGTNVMGQIKLTETSNSEGVYINAIELVATGTGNDKTDIGNVYIYHDVDADGRVDAGEGPVGASGGGFPADNGTMTISVRGPVFYVDPNTSRYLLIVLDMGGTQNASANETFKLLTPTIYATGATSSMPIPVNVGLFLMPQKKIADKWASPCLPIHQAKTYDDGTRVPYINCSPVVSCGTGRLDHKIYVQDPDGSAGIQVYFGDDEMPTLSEGMALEFEAYLDTIGGERVLVQPTVLGSTFVGAPKPVGMRNSSLGGADWQYAPATGAGQRGVAGSVGLNNVGLLARTWGRVSEVNPSEGWFRVDDGSLTLPKVKLPTGVTPPPLHSYALVTGVISCEQDGADLKPVLLPRSADDLWAL